MPLRIVLIYDKGYVSNIGIHVGSLPTYLTVKSSNCWIPEILLKLIEKTHS